MLNRFSHVQLCDPMDCNPPSSMGFSKQEYWDGLPCPPPGDLPDTGIQSVFSASPASRFFTISTTWGCPLWYVYCTKKVESKVKKRNKKWKRMVYRDTWMARPAGLASHGRHLSTEFPEQGYGPALCLSHLLPSGCLPALPLSSVKQEWLKYIEMGEPDRTRDMDLHLHTGCTGAGAWLSHLWACSVQQGEHSLWKAWQEICQSTCPTGPSSLGRDCGCPGNLRSKGKASLTSSVKWALKGVILLLLQGTFDSLCVKISDGHFWEGATGI